MDNKDISLKEDSAYPANPDSEYGWEKLFSERLYLSFYKNHGPNVKVARFHNIYGPLNMDWWQRKALQLFVEKFQTSF